MQGKRITFSSIYNTVWPLSTALFPLLFLSFPYFIFSVSSCICWYFSGFILFLFHFLFKGKKKKAQQKTSKVSFSYCHPIVWIICSCFDLFLFALIFLLPFSIIFLSFHRTIEWLGVKGTLKPTQPQHPAMGRAAAPQLRLPRAPSNPSLCASRDGAPTASLGDRARASLPSD